MWPSVAVASRMWPSVPVASRVWPSPAVASRVWPWMAVALRMWPWMAVALRMWPSVPVASRMWPWVAVASRVWPWMAVALRVWPSAPLASRMWPSAAVASRVWPSLAVALLVAVGPPAAGAEEPDDGFAATLPAAVGDVSSWLVVTGSFDSATAHGSYRLYVNPARRAIYQLMRYRIELVGGATELERGRGSAERVAFIPRPGAHEPMLCWERTSGAEPAWRAIAPATPEYLLEMDVLMRMLAVHQAARQAAPQP
jgi:hypothetical protein